ncbi:MAG: hypothetical protein ACI85O_003371 [Saprospiraceae bacterium]
MDKVGSKILEKYKLSRHHDIMAKIVKPLGSIDRHLDKKEILELAQADVEAIITAGNYDLLQVYVEMKRYETYLNGILEQLKEPAYAQAAEKGEKSFDYNEAKVTVSRYTKYDYSIDSDWSNLDDKVKNMTDLRKKREAYLKQCNESNTMVDDETGEVIEGFELPKEVRNGLIIKL